MVAKAGSMTSTETGPTPVARIELLDGLQFDSGDATPVGKPVLIFLQAPPSWFAEGTVTARAKAALLARLYGEDWLQGNGDGSRYVVQTFDARLLAPGESEPALHTPSARTWWYVVDAQGALEQRGPGFAAR
jgi:hypothetical protein